MFSGDYNFFDYKYNIIGYHGQDYGSIAQYIYLGISFIMIIILLFLLRKKDKKQILKIIRFISIFLIVFYIIKTTWESIYDIKITGSFNYGLLPLDSCSIVMLAGIIAGFSEGKIKEYALGWLMTGGIIGGLATMMFLHAFKYYPFLSFGAFYSMIWHFLMVFLGLMIIIYYKEMKYSDVYKGFIFHLLFSLIVIPIDFIFNYDFMMYLNLDGIPFFEAIATKLTAMNLQILNPFLMLALYFLSFNLVYLLYWVVKWIKRKVKLEKNN